MWGVLFNACVRFSLLFCKLADWNTNPPQSCTCMLIIGSYPLACLSLLNLLNPFCLPNASMSVLTPVILMNLRTTDGSLFNILYLMPQCQY